MIVTNLLGRRCYVLDRDRKTQEVSRSPGVIEAVFVDQEDNLPRLVVADDDGRMLVHLPSQVQLYVDKTHSWKTSSGLETDVCQRCSVRRRSVPPRGKQKFETIEYLVAGEWTRVRPGCQ